MFEANIQSLVESELPALPEVAVRVAALTRDLNSSTREIADAIGYDPVLSARVLRAANSPLYYLERDVTTLVMAVNALGNDNIHQLIVASSVMGAFQRKGPNAAIESTLSEHSMAVGLAAREIMTLLELRGTEQGFICGLLHDIGKLLMLRHDPVGYRRIFDISRIEDFLDAERLLFGFTHAQVGALAAKHWGLPDTISQVIYHHHQPAQAHEGMLTTRVVDVADALANAAGLGIRGASETDLTQHESVIVLNLSAGQLKEVWERTQSQVAETLTLLSR